jgi:exopolysaccharide biosynthesis WecB/TagA/CpsF family protein
VPTVVGATPEEMARRLSEGNPAVRCIVAPIFDVFDHALLDGVAGDVDALVREIDAQFVFVGVSMPKHHRLANALRGRWLGDPPALWPNVLLVGAAPEFTLGLTRRAPQWMQRTGTEWVHRLLLDPRRMARRYLVDDLRFVGLVWREWRRPTAESEPAGR